MVEWDEDKPRYLRPPRCQSETGNALRESEVLTIAPALQQPSNHRTTNNQPLTTHKELLQSITRSQYDPGRSVTMP
ncbi:MAG: hypothetical protein ICV78_12845 [Tolypothrix sp. Co-bin9]|nr:hypothetical protein [Tolypothrix sp. Co-bin9]